MIRFFGGTCLAVLLLAAPAAPFAQTAEPDESAAEVPVQAEAVEALDRMAAHLRTLKSFTLIADTREDDVLDSGEKLEMGGRSIYKVRGNDRLFLSRSDDQAVRDYYYNGKTVTQWAPNLGYYNVFEAPATTVEMLDLAFEKYGVAVPLADLFYWGTERSNVKSVSSAYFVGEGSVNGATCNHYAYRTTGVDWQVWIRKEGEPLPCKLVITDTEEASKPQYGATLTWSTADTLDDKTFEFTPPEGAREIEEIVVEQAN
jgi:hypothetical protein